METITLVSSDNKSFNVEYDTNGKVSETIDDFILEKGVEENMMLPEVTGVNLKIIVSYLKDKKVNFTDENFVDITNAANYLSIEKLMNDAREYLKQRLEGKTPDEMAKILGVERDMTEEEITKSKEENAWMLE